eukprot:1186536-Prorocentrum_minimum.AAC.3
MEKCVATILGWAAARTALASPAAHRVENVTTTDAGPNSSATHTPRATRLVEPTNPRVGSKRLSVACCSTRAKRSVEPTQELKERRTIGPLGGNRKAATTQSRVHSAPVSSRKSRLKGHHHPLEETSRVAVRRISTRATEHTTATVTLRTRRRVGERSGTTSALQVEAVGSALPRAAAVSRTSR